MSTMVSYHNDKLATNFLSKEEIKRIAPKVFNTKPTNPNVTDRYVVASTEQVIDDLAEMGWYPVDAKQQKMRKENSIRSFHIVAFQNPEVAINKVEYLDENGEKMNLARTEVIDGIIYGYDKEGKSFVVTEVKSIESYPRIILTNSYDGFNAFTFRVGLFRLVCSNGCVVCTESFADVSVRHTKYNVEVLREIVAKAIKSVDEQIGTYNTMQTIQLTDEQKNEFAIKALRIRQGLSDDERMDVDEESVTEMLVCNREEDKGDDLWRVFNVLQEKITKGGAVVSMNGKKARKMRGIKAFAKDIKINQELYKTALSYIPTSAAA